MLTNRLRPRLALALVLGTAAMAPAADPRRDVHSYARPDQIKVTSLGLDLSIDFGRKRIVGVATEHLERAQSAPANAPLVLDTRDLTITNVLAGPDEKSLRNVPSILGETDKVHGAPLSIRVRPEDRVVRILYHTSPGSTALQWLDPQLTAGKQKPFLFSQGEAIHTRSWIPIQDSPAVRATYTASIQAPPGMTAVMAADQVRGDVATGKFQYQMTQAIPPYLIAVAVGDLAFRELGPTTGVYAEPSVVDKAAFEFADTQRMVQVAAERFGPYRWGRYDILVLPPSFPFGGMENPKLTFATPTILAGDRSLVALVAHELAHSWSGNLVTNATWRDFWLNEGFTVYIERRIVEDVYGPGVAAMERVLGLVDLEGEIKSLPPRDQILHVDLDNRDPDEGFTRVPYDKGALFLERIESVVGRSKFDAFLKGYFERNAFQSITTADFLAQLDAELLSKIPGAKEQVDVHAWTENPGLNETFTPPVAERFKKIDAFVADWKNLKAALKDLDTKGWVTQEWLRFLLALPEEMPVETMAELDKLFQFTPRGNVEIAGQWLVMSVRNHYAPAYPRLESFLTSIGRRKFLMPLYNELKKTPGGLARARAIYAKARPNYHPIAVDSVDKVIGKP